MHWNEEKEARAEILKLVGQYYEQFHKPEGEPAERILYAGRVYDNREMENLVSSALDFWLTAGEYAREFEDGLASFLGVPYCLFVNSGSSANLLAFMALIAPELGGRAIRRGDEVITVAAGFPTTVAPILQFGAVPVFADVTIPGYNIDVSKLEHALSEKTKAVMLAHTLGNPFDLAAVSAFCKKHCLWLIEDNCDALGAQAAVDGKLQLTGSVGDIGTSSFYPAHHMTTGEGGAVYTKDQQLARILKSMRDWGRDCVCPGGQDNACGHRFDRQFGGLPLGFDHKYVYSHLGYNLKGTDMQAAIGVAQLEKLPGFVEKRRENFNKLYQMLAPLEKWLILPEALPGSRPSWFGFPITCRQGTDCAAVTAFLEEGGIQTRRLFAGNLLRHPLFTGADFSYRVAGALPNTDRILKDTFWLGVYPGLTNTQLTRMAQRLFDFFDA